jgi:hypothetical protein
VHLVGDVLISSLLGPCANQAQPHHPAFLLKLILHLPFLPPLQPALLSSFLSGIRRCYCAFRILTHAFPTSYSYFSVRPPNYILVCFSSLSCVKTDSLWRFSSSALHFFVGGGSELRKELKLPPLSHSQLQFADTAC